MTDPSAIHIAFLALSVALLGSGCVAFSVGSQETFTHTEKIVETSPSPLRSTVLSAEGRFQRRGTDVDVGLGLTLEESFEKRLKTEVVTVRKQKRLAIGFFPGAAECVFMPEGALQPAWAARYGGYVEKPVRHRLYENDPRPGFGSYASWHLISLASCGLIHGIATIDSLFVQPFADWHCEHDFIGPDMIGVSTANNKRYYDASLSPKLQSLNKFALSERRGIGVYTCFDNRAGKAKPVSHLGLVGAHKYLVLFVDEPVQTLSPDIDTETRMREEFANGPFIAEFSIPALKHADWKRVSARETRTTFALPAVERDCTVEAILSFREDNSANGRNAGELTKQALAKTVGRTWRFDVALKGTGRQGQIAEPVQRRPADELFRIVTIKPLEEGRYLVRVEVKDQSKTFPIIPLIKPEVYRIVREDFQSKNPGEPAQFVRESMRYETERDGKILSFTGWVFSVRPEEDGWNYNADTRRGWIRLRIVGGIPATEVEKWAHENIGEIVKSKNIALEAGKAPPPGATYRSLDESFKNGILTVEFEAIQ